MLVKVSFFHAIYLKKKNKIKKQKNKPKKHTKKQTKKQTKNRITTTSASQEHFLLFPPPPQYTQEQDLGEVGMPGPEPWEHRAAQPTHP